MTTTKVTYAEAANDTKKLRTYLAQTYGATLTFGGPSTSVDQAYGLTKRYAKKAGLTFDQALEQLKNDYDAASDLEEGIDRTHIVTAIAKKTIGIDNLETRNSDSLDFYDINVANLKDALLAAYQAGRNSARNR